MFNIKQVFAPGGKKKIIILLAILVVLVVTDGLMTQYLVPSGKASEANPFIEPLVGEPVFLMLKIVGALICAVILFDVHRRYPRLGIIATWLAVAGYSVIVLWNTSLVLII